MESHAQKSIKHICTFQPKQFDRLQSYEKTVSNGNFEFASAC